MTLVDGFKEFAKKAGISLSSVKKERMDDTTLLYFNVDSDENIKYLVQLALFDDNKLATISIIKDIQNSNILPKVNDLNLDYRYYTFVVYRGTISIQHFVNTDNDFSVVAKDMLQMIRIAKVEFKNFK